MTAIIFGALGQDGVYLSQLLLSQGINVVGIARSAPGFVDITDFAKISELVINVRPDFIFHLAANSTTHHHAWKENHETICTGTLNILEAVYIHKPDCKVFLSGSGLQFLNQGNPIIETDPFDATSPYCVSRIHSVYAARYYRKIGLKIYVGYFFNHDSPLRSSRHINKKIVDTVNRIAAGSNEKLEIGDMDAKKEYGFAGDIVKAIWTLVNQNNVYECVIGTGVAYTIKDWVEQCFSIRNLSWTDHVSINQNFVPQYKVLVSNPKTIFSLGWKPEMDMVELAKIMMS